MTMIEYISQGGPHHPKHGGGHYFTSPTAPRTVAWLPPAHPFIAFILHYFIAISSIYAVHDTFFSERQIHEISDDESIIVIRQRQAYIAQFLFFYTVVLFAARYLSSYRAGRLRHFSVLYELTWLCNSTLVMSCISYSGWNNDHWLFIRRRLVATSCAVAVSVDQLLWYVDLVVYVISGTFPFGVIKYLTWKQTLWIDRCTCTHHLWTIPLLLYGARGLITWESFQLSVYIVTCHVLLSRWLTPQAVQCRTTTKTATNNTNGGDGMQNITDPNCYRYLNVNLSHELWRDVTIPCLQISNDNPTCLIYFMRLLLRWHLFNALVFAGVLLPTSRIISVERIR